MNGAFGTDSISPAASSPLRSVNRKKPTPLSSNSNDLSAQPPTLLYTRRTVCPIEQEIKLESSVVEFIRPKTVGPCCRNESNKTQRVFYFQIGFALFAPFMYYEQRGLSICKWAAPVVKRYTHTHGERAQFQEGVTCRFQSAGNGYHCKMRFGMTPPCWTTTPFKPPVAISSTKSSNARMVVKNKPRKEEKTNQQAALLDLYQDLCLHICFLSPIVLGLTRHRVASDPWNCFRRHWETAVA